jgi:glycosyltransferase involved in cell wall biosynthesis
MALRGLKASFTRMAPRVRPVASELANVTSAGASARTICYLAGSSGDWGGASRVLFANLELLNRERYRPIVLLPSPGPIEPRLKRLGIRYEIWGKDHEPDGKLQYVLDIVRVAKFFKRNHVELLHINHAGYWRPAEVLAAKLVGIPIVTHYHRTIKEPGPFVKYSSLILAVSEYTATHSEPRSAQKVVIHNSVQLDRFDHARDIRNELGLGESDVVVSFIGQIRTIKGIDLFIEMAHRIAGRGVKFLIVGECRDPGRFEGSYTEERLRTEIGADERIRYVGYRSDVENVYRSSDIIVMPSRWGEPFGLINIEAGAARRPMVSTRDGGIPEIIRHGENGFLVEPNDLAGLIRCTTLLIEDKALRLRMGQRARQIVEEQFTEGPVRKLERAYDALLGRESEACLA